MTGNDADTISMHAPGTGTWKAHGENAYVWAAADAAAKLYEQLGNTEQAKYYRDLADKIKADVLELMWCEECQKFETYAVRPTGTQHNANQPNLVKYTESNNYNYFAVGLVPDDAASVTKYKEALKAFSNGKEFPIFPFYTANQVHNQEVSGSNNFSNINFTVQLRLYESALRTYDKEQTYITDDMLAMMAEWMAWNVYPDAGDIRYPNNNEFHNIDGRTYENYYRSWIYHNILGNYTYLFIEDMAGIQPRSDEKIELSPIDFSYDHFMVNNVRYHGHDLTVVWDKPDDGKTWYNGYTTVLNGSFREAYDANQATANAWGWAVGALCVESAGDQVNMFPEASYAETPSMEKLWTAMETLEEEYFLKVVTGEASLDGWDDFVSEWKNLGGDRIPAEMEQYIAENR